LCLLLNELHCLFFKFFVIPLSMFSHVNTPPWTHYRQSVNYCPLFILASPVQLLPRKVLIFGVFRANSDYEVRWYGKCRIIQRLSATVSDSAENNHLSG
ncbi:hypothetical protein, partial [Paenibacillus odorifer]|uniref:hypothetical protein n=1 Tax=Paenibacillus odorifer TaxID=189426 RepID=UPI001BAF49E3